MKIDYIYRKISICTLFTVLISVSGCKKFVEIDPPIDSIPAVQVFDTDAKADAVIRGLYVDMVGSTNYAFGGAVSVGLGLSADELTATTLTTLNSYPDLYNNSVSSSNLVLGYYWGPMYNMIYVANATIEGINASTQMSAAAKLQYLAEAKFIRAANYFYLLNLFGDVPMPITSNYKVNSLLPRTPVANIYNLILDDLKFAQANLTPAYISGANRYRANRYAVSALLARVYLYLQDYADAEAMATDVIDGAVGKVSYNLENTLTNTFLLTSKEVILQIVQPDKILYTWEGYAFISAGAPNYQISDALYTSFETGDLRKTNWIKTNTVGAKAYNFPYKYKINSGTTATGPRTEALVFLRLAEVYLIRAEARAQQAGKLAAAIADLDVVRNRAGISLIANTKPTINQADLLAVIAHERFVEFFAELGHRWLDLKRTGQADIVLKNKPNWRPEAKLFPIPAGDIIADPFLKQNPGYSN